MSIKAVVFDMDGVLIDARDWHFEALNYALGIFGFEISRSSHEEEFDGLPTREKLNILSRRVGLPLSLHFLINEIKQQQTLQLAALRCRPVFQHEYILQRLRESGYKTAVATNSIRRTTMTMLQNAAVLEYLDVVVTNEDVTYAKPNPEIYLRVAELLQVSPSQMLVLEDNPNGIQSAKRAGCHVLEVRDPNFVRWDLIKGRLIP
jgi:HAD superfamily hydrolase (TIGR01509 family)